MNMKRHVMSILVCMNIVSLYGVPQHKNLVQEHINKLEAALKTDPLYANDRRKVIGYLRGYFNNKMHEGKKRLKHLANPHARSVADLIVGDYEDIVKKVGNHQKAATSYAQRATGVVALNIRPHNAGSSKKSMPGMRATAAEPMPKPATSKKSGWLEGIESMVGGGSNQGAATQQSTTAGGRTGVVAAGAAGAAAGTYAATKASPTKKTKKAKKTTGAKKKKNGTQKKIVAQNKKSKKAKKLKAG